MWLIWIVIFAVGLAQLPLIVDCLRTFFPKWRITRVAGRVNNVLLFCLLGSLAAVAFFYYFLNIYLPLTVSEPFTTIRGWAHIVFASWLCANMVLNYLLAVFTSPGQRTGEVMPDHPPSRPPTYIACKQCKCEVMYMDHHCPFTGNCVGLENYRYFILHLVYAMAGLSYAVWLTYPYFKMCHLPTFLWFFKFTTKLQRPDETAKNICAMLRGHSLISVPASVGIVALVGLLVWQAFMLLADTPTHFVLRQRGVSLCEACGRIGQKTFLCKNSRWRVMLQQRTQWYQILFPFPNWHSEMKLISEHKNKTL